MDVNAKLAHGKAYKVIEEELKAMGTGEAIDFGEFLARLKLTLDEYIFGNTVLSKKYYNISQENAQ